MQTVKLQPNGDVIVTDERTLWTDEDFGEVFICVHLEPLLALLRSASSEQGSKLMRQLLDEQFIRPLAKWLGGKQAELRVSLIASTLLGLALTRDVLKSERLEQSDADTIVKLVAPVLQDYVDG